MWGSIYQALYRKYRSRTFDEVCGQEQVTETLKAQVASGRLSHAYLFIGTRGTGKTSCAKILAKAVNCEHPVNGNPCCQCAACRGIDDGTVLDVVEIDAASNNGVDNIRALRDEAIFSPASVKKRVYIVDEVHMLSIAAFNALLKILEEPPEHLMFILATTELRKVPATILSRCQRYSFRRLDVEVISKHLDYIASQEGFKLTHEASELLARLADGGMRDAISLLDQCSSAPVIDEATVLEATGLAGNRRVASILSAVAKHDSAAALDTFAELWRDGKDPASLLSDLCALMRDVLLLGLAPKGGRSLLSGAYDTKTLAAFSRAFTREELLRNMQRAQEAIVSLKDNPSPRTAVEICLVSLCDPGMGAGLPELIARISRLEAGAPPPRAPAAPEPEDLDLPAPPAPKARAEARPAPEAKAAREPEPVREPAPAPEPEPMPEPGPVPELKTTPEPEPAPVPEPVSAPGPEDGGYIRDEAEPTPEPVGRYFEPEPPETLPDRPDNLPEPPAADGGADWSALVAALKGRLRVGAHRLLTDPLQVNGKLAGGRLSITFMNGFAEKQLNTTETLALFRSAAEALCGCPVELEVRSEDGGEKLASRDLEELQRFKQVKFI